MRIAPGDPAWAEVEAFVATTNPVMDLLLHADVVSALGRHSTVWAARRGAAIAALAYAFPLHPARPALGVKGETPADEAALVDALVAAGEWRTGYVICPKAQKRQLWSSRGQAAPGHDELHMGLEAADWRPPEPHPAVRPATLAELDAFYRAQGAEAWSPLQFETGPYVVAEVEGAIVAAAGTHFSYPALAQLGNVLTAPAHRGQGWARACTAAVASALAARGHPMLSLFVASGNAAARRVYEHLGFRPLRELAAFAWEAPAT